jgi:8-oxo-dGTP pyrophosphatase MutT (NUDIX family)
VGAAGSQQSPDDEGEAERLNTYRITIQRVAGTAESEMPTVKVVHLIMEGQAEAGKVCLSNEHDDYAWVDPEDILKMDLVEHFKMFAMEYVAR